MKASRLFLLILPVVAGFVSCSGSGSTDEYFDPLMARPWVESVPDFTEIWPADATSAVYRITCSREWTCTLKEPMPWVLDYTKSGDVGESVITIRIQPNTGSAARTAAFSFKYGLCEAELSLEQEGTGEDD